MIEQGSHARTRLLCIAVVLLTGLIPSVTSAMQGVALTGWTLDQTDRPSGQATAAFENFCRNSSRQDMENLYTQMEVTAMQALAEAGMGGMAGYLPNEAQIDEILDAIEEECDREDEVSFGFTKIIYSQCRMFMDGETGQLDILVPAGADGHMVVFDGTEGARVNLTRRVQEVSVHVGQGWSSDIEWQIGPGQTEERAGYPATHAAFEYTVGMGAGYGTALDASQQAAQGGMSTEEYLQQMESSGLGREQGLQMLSGMVSSKTVGWGYFSTAVPGVDIVQSFYRTFAENVAPGGGLGSFMGGMINSQVGMLERGIPLELHTTQETRIMGRTQVSGDSSANIHSVELVNLPSDWCSRELIPPNPNIKDIDAELQQALSAGSAGPPGQPGTPQAGAGIPSFNQIMEQFSGGGASALPANPAGLTQGTAPGGSGGSSGSSADLTTDDLTQTAQLHLQALGYTVGNTAGNLDTESIIAISQFQAERGLAVTGEVTPQLIGVLSAEVDRRH